MPILQSSKVNKWIVSLLIFFTLISASLHFYKVQNLCLNEDEAAQGYNTYSVLKTGRDEYGNLPLRYLSFGENKLPLTGLLSAPFIAMFGLNELTVRLPVMIIGSLFPILFYFASYAIFRNKIIGLFAAFFASTNVWLQTTSRHQHEAVIIAAIVLLYITTLFHQKTLSFKRVLILGLLSFLGLYTYHSGKIIIPSLAIFTVMYVFLNTGGETKSRLRNMAIATATLLLGILLFTSTELMIPTNRLSNLSYFTNPAFTYEIQEGRRNGGSAIFYNKPVYGTYKILSRMVGYISPDFLLWKNDPNPRYGASYLPLMTIVEYILFVLGMLWGLSQLKKKHSFGIIFLYFFTLVSVIPAALALPEYSNTRSYLALIPLIIFSSIGLYSLAHYLKKNKYALLTLTSLLIATHIFFVYGNWNKYFNTYLNDPKTKLSWQCGMKEVATKAWQNYDKFDKIYIDNSLGQAYIYLLFYGGPYSPSKYQKVAKTMPYNEYGFWEQESFDKFVFIKNEPARKLMDNEFYIKRSE
ncbi:MAG: glycosyltransferase family 39 protein [Patescibacteria group bacterium]